MNPQQGMPFMMMAPMPQQRSVEYTGNQVPARVQVAMEYLAHLTAKTGDKEFTNQMGASTSIEGQQLQICESQTQAAACDLLTQYFKGDLNPTSWESYMVHLAHAQSPTPVACPNCQGLTPEVTRCKICSGRGVILKFGE